MDNHQDSGPQEKTTRLYFENAYLKEFEARIVGRKTIESHPAVILDQTAFYPEGGGQPCDRGTLNDIEIFRVIEEEGAILHILKEGIEAETVHGKIDWPRRFDHMQQHSGQHILSRAFDEVLKGETLSFHLGEDVSTVEIGVSKIIDENLNRVESRANAAVFTDLEIRTYFLPEEKIGTVPLRRPPKKEGLIRVVEVEGFDYSACGGTHCRRVGEIGLIKVIKWEKIRGHLRFEFVCGGRALKDYAEKARCLKPLTNIFSVVDKDLPAAVEKSQAELRSAKRKIKKLEERLAGYEAQEVLRRVPDRVIQDFFEEKSPEEARFLALQIIKKADLVVLYGASGEGQSHIILAASEGLGLDVRKLIPVVMSVIEARGGGGPSLVELVSRETDKVRSALDAVERFVRENWKL